MAKPVASDKEKLLPRTSRDADASVSTEFGKSKQKPMTRAGIMAASSYMTCAVMLVMFNKAALSSFNFPSANVITLLQMVGSTAFLLTLRLMGRVSFTDPSSAAPAQLTARGFVPWSTVVRTAPLSFAYLFYMVVSMAAVRGVSVPMYTALRRTTVVFTMLIEKLLLSQSHTIPVMSSVAIICGGAILAGVRDLSFDTYAYGLVFLANLATATYLTTIARLGKATGLNSFGLMWVNGLICAPALLIWTAASGEIRQALAYPNLHSPQFQAVIVMSCILAFVLNYTIFLNTALNSALTQTMCGNLKDFGTVTIGWVLFGGLPFDVGNLIGQLLGFVGSLFYAFCKLRGM